MDTIGFIMLLGVCLIIFGILYFDMLKIKKQNGQFASYIYNNSNLATKEMLNIDLQCLNLKPVSTLINENELVEIKDKSLISRIDSIIPNSAMTIANSNVASSTKKLSSHLLESDIPISQLKKSATQEGALRAFVIKDGKFMQNANLKPAAEKANALKNVVSVNVVMNVGSMVVGQYYMSQISGKLDTIQKRIDKVANFQDSDYKGKLLQVITDTIETSQFQCDIVESEDIRFVKLNSLEIDKKECKRLIGHANEEIKSLLKFDSKDYNAYVDSTKEIEKWYRYQQMMLHVLEQMSMLDYTLNLRKINMEQAYGGFYKYKSLADATNNLVRNWHIKQQNLLKIKVGEKLRKKEGLDKIISQVKILDKNRSYKEIEDEVYELLDEQMNNHNNFIEDKRDLYNENVKIIKKDEKYYFLPLKKDDEDL